MEARINEIFTSIQGEGPYVGYNQLFIRFCGCNMSCKYCDTEFLKGEIYTPQKLFEKIQTEYDLKSLHSVSLTGGEPLLSSNFLSEFLLKVKGLTRIYLETNATLTNELLKIKNHINIISADIKLPSSSRIDTFDLHDKFLYQCYGIETFAKIVFDKNITDEEIIQCVKLGKKYNLELILQPEMKKNKISVSMDFCTETLNKFTKLHAGTRLIPQMHKFLNIR